MLSAVRALLVIFVALLCSNAVIAASDKPVIIGLDADMSAVAVEGGTAIKRGALLAIAEINRRGGVLGRPLELKVMDHRGNPARGIRNIETLAKLPDLLAVLGGVHTPVALAELPVIHENEIIYLGPWAAGTAIVDNGYSPNFVYRLSVRDEFAAEVMLKHAAQRGFKSIGLILERTGWGRSNLASLKHHSQQYGITIEHVSWINWHQQNFESEANLIISHSPDALITVVNAPEGAVIARALLEQELNLPVISHWGLAGGAFITDLGSEALQQLDITILQTFSFHQATQSDTAARVMQAYRAMFDEDAGPDSIAGVVGFAHAYDLVNLIAQAANKASSLNSGEVARALEKITNYSGLIKQYEQPFSHERHDALTAEDYFMAHFNSSGGLEPFSMLPQNGEEKE